MESPSDQPVALEERDSGQSLLKLSKIILNVKSTQGARLCKCFIRNVKPSKAPYSGTHKKLISHLKD